MTFWIVSTWTEGAMFKIWLKSVEFKGIYINDISRVLAGVDDDFDIPEFGWCPS